MTGSLSPGSLVIRNAQVSGYREQVQIKVDPQGVIAAIAPMSSVLTSAEDPAIAVLDAAGDWISLGGVDVQINGALGIAFPELSPDSSALLPKIGQFLWDHGVDGFLPTLVTSSVESIQRSLSILADAPMVNLGEKALGEKNAPGHTPTAQILGVHLEGPFLNPAKRGAHPEEFLLPLTVDTVKRVLGDYVGLVKVITLAPELDPTGTVIPYLRSLGITVSLGHSMATAAQAKQAFSQGATMVTHAFNAMPGLHHREPGLLGAALTTPGVSCGIIADGQHVDPVMLDLLLRIGRGSLPATSPSLDRPTAYPSGLFLVSDALAPLGLPDGLYPWDSRQIQVTDGTARLLDGTLSGTTRPLLTGAQQLVRWGLCSAGEAIALATESPRQAIGLPGLSVGQPATLLRWRSDDNSRTLTWERLS
ncbi:MAG TPA: N-acetylglucosamine-6-phosphate deacetylase [Chroococcidiopsis sp.]